MIHRLIRSERIVPNRILITRHPSPISPSGGGLRLILCGVELCLKRGGDAVGSSVAAVLDGRAYVYESFTETAKMKASEDVQRVGKCAETMAVCGVPSSQKRIECQEVKQLECDPKLAEKVDEVGERIGGKVEAAKDELKDEIRELSRNVQDLSKRRGRGGRRRHSAASSTPPKAWNPRSAGSGKLREMQARY